MFLGDIWKFFWGQLSWIIMLVALWNWPWHL